MVVGVQAGKGPQSTTPATKPALQGPQGTAPATKSALQGPRNTAPATKSALQGPQSLAPAMKSALQGPQNTAPPTKSALQGPQSLAPAMKSALQGPQNTAPPTKSALQGPQSTAPATKCALQDPQSLAPATTSENEPHVEKSRFTTPVTKSEHVEDYHHVQSAAPATKSTRRSKAAPTPCTCHEKLTWGRQSTRFPLQLPRKVTTMSENVRGTRTRAQSRQALAAATQILRACAVEMHFEDFERHESVYCK